MHNNQTLTIFPLLRFVRTGLICPLLFVVAACASSRSVKTSPGEETDLNRLVQLSHVDQRDQWFPAVEKLGRAAEEGDDARDEIWAMARVNSLGMKFVEVKPGTFIMGPDVHRASALQVAHSVQLAEGFFIAVTEVTNAHFRQLVPEFKTDAGIMSRPDMPKVNISWEDAVRFCKLLSQKEGVTYRLPTEAEWEYSCRAGSKTLFCFGDDPAELSDYAWWHRPYSAAAPVASFIPNDWGIYDMHGNAIEWVSDWFESPRFPNLQARDTLKVPDASRMSPLQRAEWYAEWIGFDSYYLRCAREGTVQNPKGVAQGGTHVLRGGGWPATAPLACSSTARCPLPIFDRRPFKSRDVVGFRQATGFRVVRQLEGSDAASNTATGHSE